MGCASSKPDEAAPTAKPSADASEAAPLAKKTKKTTKKKVVKKKVPKRKAVAATAEPDTSDPVSMPGAEGLRPPLAPPDDAVYNPLGTPQLPSDGGLARGATPADSAASFDAQGAPEIAVAPETFPPSSADTPEGDGAAERRRLSADTAIGLLPASVGAKQHATGLDPEHSAQRKHPSSISRVATPPVWGKAAVPDDDVQSAPDTPEYTPRRLSAASSAGSAPPVERTRTGSDLTFLSTSGPIRTHGA